jgi:large subunit ribosomal protein L21
VFAIVKSGGKQFKVRVGEAIDVEKLDVEMGGEVRLDQVLLAANDGDVAYGRPVIEGAVVTAEVVRQYRGPKLIVFRYKSKSRYRRRTGHRQSMTRLAIQTIDIPGWEIERAPARTSPEESVAANAATEAAPAPPLSPVAAETPVSQAAEHGVDESNAPRAEGSAAPPGDVLPAVAPAAQVQAADGDGAAISGSLDDAAIPTVTPEPGPTVEERP